MEKFEGIYQEPAARRGRVAALSKRSTAVECFLAYFNLRDVLDEIEVMRLPISLATIAKAALSDYCLCEPGENSANRGWVETKP